jgi:hypothetical protein
VIFLVKKKAFFRNAWTRGSSATVILELQNGCQMKESSQMQLHFPWLSWALVDWNLTARRPSFSWDLWCAQDGRSVFEQHLKLTKQSSALKQFWISNRKLTSQSRVTGSGYYFVDGPGGLHHQLVKCNFDLDPSDPLFQVATTTNLLAEYPVAF